MASRPDHEQAEAAATKAEAQPAEVSPAETPPAEQLAISLAMRLSSPPGGETPLTASEAAAEPAPAAQPEAEEPAGSPEAIVALAPASGDQAAAASPDAPSDLPSGLAPSLDPSVPPDPSDAPANEEEPGGRPSSGVSVYSDDSGRLLGSIDRLGMGESLRWDSAPAGDEHRDGYGVQALVPPRVSLGFIDGALYPKENTVMESDPYGMRLGIVLSQASSGTDQLVLSLGGTAQMAAQGQTFPGAGDYCYLDTWLIHIDDPAYPDPLPAADYMADLGGGQFALVLPAGISSFCIQIPLIDDNLSQPDRTFSYQVMSTGGYQLADGASGRITIIDENRVQEINPGAPLPPLGAPGAGDIVWGPRAHIQVRDEHGDRVQSRSVPENMNGPVEYRFTLEGPDGNPYVPLEDIAITIKISGRNGLVLTPGDGGQDFRILEDIADAFRQLYPDAALNPATGELTFTIPAGGPAADVNFSGSPIADTRVENQTPRESLDIAITQAQGNETLIGDGAVTEVVDIPQVSVSLDHRDFFESAGHPDLPNEVTFTFSLSSPAGADTTVLLDWSNGTALSADDYEWYLNGVKQNGPLDSSITFARGQDTATIRVVAKDDKLSEGPEALRVTVRPESGADTDNYHPAPGRSTAEAVLQDDTGAVPGNDGQYLDGPIVRILACDADGNLIGQSDGLSLPEEQGAVYFRPVLYDRVTGQEISGAPEEEIRVSFSISAKNAQTVFGSGAPASGDDFVFSNPGPGSPYTLTPILDGHGRITGYEVELTITPGGYQGIGPGSDYLLKGEIQNDSNIESGEGFVIAVTEAAGHEASAGGDFAVNFRDVPVLSISADPTVSESAGTLRLTLSADPIFEVDTQVWIKITLEDPGSSLEDFKLGDLPAGVEYLYSGGEHYLILNFPGGTSSCEVAIPLNDDWLSEDAEGFGFSLAPSGGNTPDAQQLYAVHPSAGQATVSVTDDTAGGQNNPLLDGPLVSMAACRADGTLLLGSDGKPLAVADLSEQQGDIYLRPLFTAQDGSPLSNEQLAALTQDTVIKFSISANNAQTVFAAIGSSPTLNDGQDFVFSTPDGVYSLVPQVDSNGRVTGYEVTLTVAAGEYAPDAQLDGKYILHGKLQQDAQANESGEGFNLAVTEVTGNEAKFGDSVSVGFTDMLVLSLSAPHTHVSESEATLVFEIGLSAEAPDSLTLRLELDAPGAGGATLSGPGADVDLGSIVIKDANGAIINGASASIDSSYTGGGQLILITVPQGTSGPLSVHVPINDDAASENLEKIQATLQNENGQAVASDAAAYQVDSANNQAEVTIVDDTRGWPNSANSGEPAEHGGLEGPIVRIVPLDEHGDPILGGNSGVIPENAGTVRYAIVLCDPDDPSQLYSGSYREDIEVYFDCELQNGASVADVQINLGGNGAVLQNAGDHAGSYKITLPAGSNAGNSYEITVTPKADTDLNESGEGFTFRVTGTAGNESAPGGDYAVTLRDVPVLTLQAEKPEYSESAHAYVGFALGLSAPCPEAGMEVRIKLGSPTGQGSDGFDLGATLSGPDADIDLGAIKIFGPDGIELSGYTVSLAPGAGAHEATLVITLPKGAEGPLSIRLPIHDDIYDESYEKISAELLHEGGKAASADTDTYQVDQNHKNDSATIIDDTQPWTGDPFDNPEPEGHGPGLGDNKGPRVSVEYLGSNVNGQTAADREVTVLESVETEGWITYRLNLEAEDGNGQYQAYGAAEDVTVTIRVDFEGNITYGEGVYSGGSPHSVGGGDFYFDLAAMQAAGYTVRWVNNGTHGYLTVTIPKGQSYVDLPTKIVKDQYTEKDRYQYDANGELVRDENGNPVLTTDDEAFKMTIESVKGNESWIDTERSDIHTAVDEVRGGIQVSLEVSGAERYVTADEGENVSFTLRLTQESPEEVLVIIRVSGGADAGDFDRVLQITIPPNTQSYAVQIPVKNDTLSEGANGSGTEYFTLEIVDVIGGEASIDEKKAGSTEKSATTTTGRWSVFTPTRPRWTKAWSRAATAWKATIRPASTWS